MAISKEQFEKAVAYMERHVIGRPVYLSAAEDGVKIQVWNASEPYGGAMTLRKIFNPDGSPLFTQIALGAPNGGEPLTIAATFDYFPNDSVTVADYSGTMPPLNAARFEKIIERMAGFPR